MMRTLLGFVATVGGLALMLSGCSSKTDTQAPPTQSSPEAHGGLAECLKNHGVTDAGGPAAVLGPPSGVDQSTWETAMKACSSLAPGPAAP